MRKIIPLGDRILVKRRTVGNKIGKGLIELPQNVQDRETDIADVLHIPDNTFADEKIINKAEDIIESLTEKAKNGDAEALKACLTLNSFLKIKSIKVGDVIMISKYTGVTFNTTESQENLTIVEGDNIIAIVRDS